MVIEQANGKTIRSPKCRAELLGVKFLSLRQESSSYSGSISIETGLESDCSIRFSLSATLIRNAATLGREQCGLQIAKDR